jgi:hypothetical protein
MYFAAIAAALTVNVNLQNGHESTDQRPMMKQIAFLKGSWVGNQDFNVPSGKLTAPATDTVADAVQGRYLEEQLTTSMPNRPMSDTRHFISYDIADQKFKAYWFNDTQVGPMELDGTVAGNVLTLQSPPDAKHIFRAVYRLNSSGQLTFELSLQAGSEWTKLFTSTYTRK